MQHNYMKFIAGVLLVAMMGACDESDPNAGQTATKDMAGEWFVTVKVDGVDVSGGHIPILTSNTAANVANQILITDYIDPNATSGNFWSFKIKANANQKSLTFNAQGAPSKVQVTSSREDYETHVNVMDGQIFKMAGKSKTGVVVDSVYFKIQFEDDATPYGTTYIMSGHKRTGFAEDEY